eukprot:850550-Pelagomonas_calceolata.AAC.4
MKGKPMHNLSSGARSQFGEHTVACSSFSPNDTDQGCRATTTHCRADPHLMRWRRSRETLRHTPLLLSYNQQNAQFSNMGPSHLKLQKLHSPPARAADQRERLKLRVMHYIWRRVRCAHNSGSCMNVQPSTQQHQAPKQRLPLQQAHEKMHIYESLLRSRRLSGQHPCSRAASEA